MAAAPSVPWLKIEETDVGFEVHWRVERRSGRNTVLDLGRSQCFATKTEAQRWGATFARAFGEDEPSP